MAGERAESTPAVGLALAFGILRLLLVLALLPFALDWRSPLLASIRPWALVVLIAASVVTAGFEIWRAPRSKNLLLRGLHYVTLGAAVLVLLATALLEARFHWLRHEVLATDTHVLEPLGRHVVVGYRDPGELRALIERRAIAGVFLAPRNVRGKDAAEIRRDIDALQDIRRSQGLPPLWIAADQEGGAVARLSPPLTKLPPLAELVANNTDRSRRQAAVRQYAGTQARELAALGVNLNFAPVVDLNFDVRMSSDSYTHIAQRAIASDPDIVREVAGDYCATLREAGVLCTLKHFPGLGRVTSDTHLAGADLDASRTQLATSDWIPFRALMGSGAVTMLSHARLTSVDRDHPASFSRPVIDIVRREWGYDGVLITDDFSMGAVYKSREGIGGGSVAALNAGVDLILISYDTDQYFVIMQGLLGAAAAGTLQRGALADSDRRLGALSSGLP